MALAARTGAATGSTASAGPLSINKLDTRPTIYYADVVFVY